MNIKKLKVGDKVFIKKGLVPGKYYGATSYVESMAQGWCEVLEIFSKSGTFSVKTDNGNSWEFLYNYTPEMVDWEKTNFVKETLEEVTSKRRVFKYIKQTGAPGAEITKGVTYGGKEIVVKNNSEENDPEKATMLLMLKARGVTYSDIKEEAKKVEYKWRPRENEKYYYINTAGVVDFLYWVGHSLDNGRLAVNNCFKTRVEAEKKLEKIKEVLRGE